MTPEENKALVRRFNYEAFDLADERAPERYLIPDFLNHVSGKRGIEDFQRIMKYVRTFLPDSKTTIDQEIAEGDRVMVLMTTSGTHLGEIRVPWGTIPPTGKHVSFQSVRIYRIQDGKIAEHWAMRDDLTMLLQIGALPIQAQASS